MAFDLIIFDLDGTLVDSKLDLALAVNATRRHYGLPPLDIEQVSSYVGNGAPVLIRRAMGPEFNEQEIQQALEYFLNHYREHMLDHTRLYPTVAESLDRLKKEGLLLSVLTNKPVRFSSDILAGLGVADYFFRIYGGNSFEQKKPDPAGVNAILQEAGVSGERALLVGDSAVDILTARNAGIAACGVTYGFQPESLAEYPPDFMVNSMAELAGIVIRNRQQKETVK